MNLCKYCDQVAIYPPKTKWGGWCCSPRFYDCLVYKKNRKDNSTPWNKGKIGVQTPWNKGLPGTFTNKKHSEETKLKIATAMQGNNNGKHRGDRQSYYNGIRMDSSWEVLVAQYLDSLKISWTYGNTVFKLSNTRSYRPDFILHDGTVIEVKGYWRKANLEKFQLWRQLYPNIYVEVWDKVKLKSLGIL